MDNNAVFPRDINLCNGRQNGQLSIPTKPFAACFREWGSNKPN